MVSKNLFKSWWRERKKYKYHLLPCKNGHTWIAVLFVLKYYHDNLIYQIFWQNFYHLLFLAIHFKKNLREISTRKNVKATHRYKISGVFPSKLYKCIFLETLLIFSSSVHPQLPLFFLQNLKYVQITSPTSMAMCFGGRDWPYHQPH